MLFVTFYRGLNSSLTFSVQPAKAKLPMAVAALCDSLFASDSDNCCIPPHDLLYRHFCIAPSDVFYDGFDHLALINEQIGLYALDTVHLFGFNNDCLLERIQQNPFQGYHDDFETFHVSNGHLWITIPEDDPYFATNIYGYGDTEFYIPLLPEYSPYDERIVLRHSVYEQTQTYRLERLMLDGVQGDPTLATHLVRIKEDLDSMQDDVAEHAKRLLEIAEASNPTVLDEYHEMYFSTLTNYFDEGMLVWIRGSYNAERYIGKLAENSYITDARLYSFATGLPVSLDPLYAK